MNCAGILAQQQGSVETNKATDPNNREFALVPAHPCRGHTQMICSLLDGEEAMLRLRLLAILGWLGYAALVTWRVC